MKHPSPPKTGKEKAKKLRRAPGAAGELGQEGAGWGWAWLGAPG